MTLTNDFIKYIIGDNLTLHFCKDGKIKILVNKKYYNIENLSHDIDFLKLFISTSTSDVLLEDGVTVGNVINALMPFKDGIELLTGCDLDSYYQMNNTPSKDTGKAFDQIVIGRTSSYVNTKGHDKHNIFYIENNLRISGVNNGDKEHYSSEMPIQKIRNVPLVIENINQNYVHQYVEEKEYITNKLIEEKIDLTFHEFVQSIFFDMFFLQTAEGIDDFDEKMDNLRDMAESITENEIYIQNEESKESKILVTEEFLNDMQRMEENEKDSVDSFTLYLEKIVKKNKIVPNIGKYSFQNNQS